MGSITRLATRQLAWPPDTFCPCRVMLQPACLCVHDDAGLPAQAPRSAGGPAVRQGWSATAVIDWAHSSTTAMLMRCGPAPIRRLHHQQQTMYQHPLGVQQLRLLLPDCTIVACSGS